MNRGFLGPALLLTAACTPPLDPPWVVAHPRELAMRVEVIAQGPYGQPLLDAEPSVNEALPLDTIRAIPRVVDPQGSVDLASLQPQWYLCDIGSCLLRPGATALPACTQQSLLPEAACAIAGTNVADLRLGDFITEDEQDLLVLNRAPAIGFVASTAQGPGTAACLANIADRVSLSGCLWMERTLALGPLGDVVRELEALGHDIERSDSLEPLLSVPRNHNPTVQTFVVTVDDGSPREYASGETVSAPALATITVVYEPTEDDLDAYELEFDGDTLQTRDTLEGRWFASREVAGFDQQIHQLVWHSVDESPVTLHYVVGDDRRGEAWGWLDFDFR